MLRAFRFPIALILGLALVTWGAARIVNSTARDWYEKDLRLRAQLVVTGAHETLVERWRDDRREQLGTFLTELTRDERIMAAAACGTDLRVMAQSPAYPREFDCAAMGAAHVREGAGAGAGAGTGTGALTIWHGVAGTKGGNVHISAIPVVDRGRPLGFVVLLHDLSFIEKREARAGHFLLATFAFLAIAASVVTIVTARLSWRGWNRELQRTLRSGSSRPEFQPIFRDVRDLIDRIVSEREADRENRAWTPERLKQTLNRYLQGERVVIIANREPYIHERTKDGQVVVRHPASGLVTALEPVMRACSGVWIAHGSGSADRDTVDADDRVRVPPGEESFSIRRVWLTPEQERGYYYGFSNEGLWPLCHIAHTRPVFRDEDWKQYQIVNEKFVDALCAEVTSPDPIILVQDYHFALAPRLIRERLPAATVIMFWHIPWPNSEHFGICPWREELLKGMLGASILGFHTQFHCNNFIDTVDRFLEARIDREQSAVVQHGLGTLVRPYPIAIEWPNSWALSAPPVAECRTKVFAELGLAPDALLGVGVDRLDYTKGVEERLQAVERLLERFPELRGKFSFVQLAAPSRTSIERYRQLNESVEHIAARINERFGGAGYRPVILLRSHHEPPAVFRFFRAADLCYVSSLHDGMNLVAKEFIASREDERGVLVLSQFTGAARELTEALIVNPYDIEECSSALASALRMSQEEQVVRMRSLRAFVAEFNVYRWAGRMLVDAARLRSRQRLTGRLTEHVSVVAESR